jgi:hypothetical protein
MIKEIDKICPEEETTDVRQPSPQTTDNNANSDDE